MSLDIIVGVAAVVSFVCGYIVGHCNGRGS